MTAFGNNKPLQPAPLLNGVVGDKVRGTSLRLDCLFPGFGRTKN
jgi:hypothetical protein